MSLKARTVFARYPWAAVWTVINVALPLVNDLFLAIWDYSINTQFMQSWMFFVVMTIANLVVVLPMPRWKAPAVWRLVFAVTILLNAASVRYFSDVVFWQPIPFIYYVYLADMDLNFLS